MWQHLKTLWRNLARKQSVDGDLDAELRSYHEMLEDEKVRAGVDAQAARREAMLELGGVEQIKEEVRDIRLGVRIEGIWTELRQSWRGLWRSPGLSMGVVGILALGMAASTVVFGVFQSVLLKPLPFRESDHVVQLWETRLDRAIDRADFTEANFWDVRAQNHSFEEVASYHYDDFNLIGNGSAEKVEAAEVTAGFFRTLGVAPILGRDFSYDEDRGSRGAAWWNGQSVVILGHRFWRNRLGSDPNIVGKTLRLDDQVYTVIGVLPPAEFWIDRAVYVPFGYKANPNRGSWEFSVIGRLARGVSAEAARSDLQRIAATLVREYPKEDKGIGFRLESSATWVASDTTRNALWVLLSAVTFLMLIACLNIANLLLVRGMARQREIAVRTALGAGRGRLVRFVMMESLLLSGIGAAFGLMAAYGILPLIRALEIRDIPRLAEAELNPWVVGFAVLIAVLTGLLSGLAPAMQAPGDAIATALREGDRQAGSRGQGRVRSTLVTVEVALSFVLLVGAGLLIRSFTQLMTVDRGFQTENRLLFSVSMPGAYEEKGIGKQFLDRFFERLSADPAVIASGAISHRPVEGGNPGMGIEASSRPSTSDKGGPWVSWRVVSPGYFRAVGLPLRSGRIFDESDKPVWQERGQPIPQRRVMISERLAKQIFPNEDPIGKHVVLWKGQSNLDAEVIGIVHDSRERGPAAGPSLTVYLPYGTNALPTEFVVQTRVRPLAYASTVRSIVASLDASLPVADVRSFEEVVERSVAPQRFNAILLGIFSGLALLLATVGIYGVLSYSVSRRTSEIGLRMALGASSGNIVRMTIGQGLQPALLGIALGAIGAWWLSRYVATLLFGVKPFDGLTYAAVVALLLMTAAVACYLPSRRAMRTDPVEALRTE